MMFHRLMWTHFVYYILAIRLFLSLSLNLTSHFSNFADFRQLQISNAWTKYYEILPAHTKTPHDTTHKIASLYFEFKYHFSTLQRKFRLLLNKGVHKEMLFMNNEIKFIEWRPVWIACLSYFLDPNMRGFLHSWMLLWSQTLVVNWLNYFFYIIPLE